MKTENLKRGCAALLTIIFATLSISTAVAQSQGVISRSVVIRDTKEAKDCRSLPKEYTTITSDGVSYYQTKGRFYIKSEDGYEIATPPAGVKISELPKGANSFEILNHKYYSYRGVIYKDATSGGYEVTLPEVGMTLPDIPDTQVREVLIDGDLYYEADGFVYKPVMDGEQYIVICTFESLKV